MTKKTVRFTDKNPRSAAFVYRPPENAGAPIAQNATLGVKFAESTRILDDWHLFGGTRWSRSMFRLRHPIVYSKRGLRNLYRRIKRFFFGDPPMILCRKKHFTIYGFCKNCRRRCECPLFEPKSKMTLSEYEEYKSAWNKDRSDLILDAMRRTDQ